MHPCRTQHPYFLGSCQITTVETTKIMKCLSEKKWPTTTAVTTLLAKSIQVTYDPKNKPWIWAHGTAHQTHRHPLKPLFLQCENDVDKLLTITWTNYWQRNHEKGVKILTPQRIYIYTYIYVFTGCNPKNEANEFIKNSVVTLRAPQMNPIAKSVTLRMNPIFLASGSWNGLFFSNFWPDRLQGVLKRGGDPKRNPKMNPI